MLDSLSCILFFFRRRTTDGNPEHCVCWTSSSTKCWQRGAAIHEQDDILYFEDRAVFSLNAAQMLFPVLIMLSTKWDSFFVYFVWYSYKIIPCFGLAVTRLSHTFIVIHVVNSLLKWAKLIESFCLDLYVSVDSEERWSGSQDFILNIA